MHARTALLALGVLPLLVLTTGCSAPSNPPADRHASPQKDSKKMALELARIFARASNDYAADNGDLFPKAATWETDLSPYFDPYFRQIGLAGDSDRILHQFKYKLDGERLTDIEDANGTVLATIEVDGITAVAYVDSSAKLQI